MSRSSSEWGSDDEYEEEEEDQIDQETGLPKSMGSMSANLMKALGLDISEVDTSTDWTPPSLSGLEHSKPIISHENLNNMYYRGGGVDEEDAGSSEDDDEYYYDIDREAEYYNGVEIRKKIGLSPNLMTNLGVGKDDNYARNSYNQNQNGKKWVPPKTAGLLNSSPLVKTKSNNKDIEALKVQKKIRAYLAKKQLRKLMKSQKQNPYRNFYPYVDDEDDDDDDDDDSEDYDDDIDTSTGLPRSMGAMSANLMAALGLDTSHVDTFTDWTPPERSGLQYSRPLVDRKGYPNGQGAIYMDDRNESRGSRSNSPRNSFDRHIGGNSGSRHSSPRNSFDRDAKGNSSRYSSPRNSFDRDRDRRNPYAGRSSYDERQDPRFTRCGEHKHDDYKDRNDYDGEDDYGYDDEIDSSVEIAGTGLRMRKQIGLSPALSELLGLNIEVDMENRQRKTDIDWKAPSRYGLLNSIPLVRTKGNMRDVHASNVQRRFRGYKVRKNKTRSRQRNNEYQFDEDDDDSDEYYYSDEDEEDDEIDPVTGLPKRLSNMSANLMSALGLDTSNIDTATDWVPPSKTGLEHSQPIFTRK